MATTSSPVLPGRLGSPEMTLRDDPRADPRMIAAMEPFGLADPPAAAPVDASSPIEDLLEYVGGGRGGLRGAVRRRRRPGCPPIEGVERRVEVIRASTATTSRVYIHRPAGTSRRLPGVLHLHGGGMVLLEAAGAAYGRWRDELAAAGLVVVGVEFRNGGGKHGPHPFPAGLDDCAAGAALGRSSTRPSSASRTLIVSGESGGGNLTLATTLRAKRDGLLDTSTAPTRCARTSPTPGRRRRPSCRRCSRTTATSSRSAMMGALAKVYDPTGEHATDPLAWPLRAAARRPRRPAAARDLGQPARPAARRGPRLRPQAARRRGAGGQPDGERHVPRRRHDLRRGHARRVPRPRSATSRASPTRCEVPAYACRSRSMASPNERKR